MLNLFEIDENDENDERNRGVYYPKNIIKNIILGVGVGIVAGIALITIARRFKERS